MAGLRRGWAIGMIAVVAIVAAGWITLVKVQTLDAAAGWVRHSQDVRLALERALSTLKDTETSTRGYIVTRSEVFIPTFQASLKQLDLDLADLHRLLRDDPKQAERARELERLMRVRLTPLQGALQDAQAGGPERDREEALRVQIEGNGLMEAVRTQAREMHAEEERLLASRLDDSEHARRTAMITSGITTLLAALLVVMILALEKRGSRKLRESEEWLSTTLRSIGDAVIATDNRGCVKYLNPVAAELTGWSTADARTRSLDEVFNIIAEDTQQPVESPVIRVLREGAVVGLANHTLLVRRDGSRFPIEDSGAPIKDSKGVIHGVVLVFKDASVQRAAEERLAASEERLRLAIEVAGLGTWDRDLATGELIWNEQLYRMMGFEPNTALTREIARSVVVAEDLDMVLSTDRRALESRTPYQLEYRIRRGDDSQERWVSVLGRYIYDDEGRATRALGIVTDITDRRRLEQRVRQTQKLDALGTLAGGIAHDFNNILSILRGNLLLIEADLPTDHPIAPAISEMSRACSRARDLVRQILTFGRQQEQDRKVISLTEVIQEALRLLRSTVPASIQIRSHFQSDLPTVLADASQIHQVVMNLGINAAQAIGSGAGLIDVELEAVHVDPALASHSPDLHEGDHVRLRIRDSGAGMTRDVLERIFEPFFTTKPQGMGTGLGLAVVRGIVKSHDGAITVYSEPGKGTQFHLYFPVLHSAPIETPKPPPAPVQGRGERRSCISTMKTRWYCSPAACWNDSATRWPRSAIRRWHWPRSRSRRTSSIWCCRTSPCPA